MELAFVTGALRRYAWAIALFAALGIASAVMLSGRGPVVYRSEAVLLAAPPSESQFTVSFGGDPDRYVSGQLSVLRSQVMAERVADRLGDGASGRVVRSLITVSHEPNTDVVTIAADSSDPEFAQAVANAYLTVYFESIRSQLEGTQAPLLDEIDAEIEELNAEIARVDAAMAATMIPFLDRDPIPSVEQVAPGLISEKSVLLNQLNELHSSRTQLRTGPRIASEVIQEATLPSEPVPSFRRVLLAIGAVGGVFAGIVAAVTLARLSPNVVTDEQAEEILGMPVHGTVPSLPKLHTERHTLLDPLPAEAERFIDSLCVRAEATAVRGSSTLTVVVTGAQRTAGATTVAAAMARRFADNGSRVVLIDGDRQDPELARLFVDGRQEAPVPAPSSLGGGRPQRVRGDLPPLFATEQPNLHVGVLDGGADGAAAGPGRLREVGSILTALKTVADVVVVDGGPLMASVSTVQLVRNCEAVVLAMPHRQAIRGLELVGAEMGDRHFLPVWVPVRRRRGRRIGRS